MKSYRQLLEEIKKWLGTDNLKDDGSDWLSTGQRLTHEQDILHPHNNLSDDQTKTLNGYIGGKQLHGLPGMSGYALLNRHHRGQLNLSKTLINKLNKHTSNMDSIISNHTTEHPAHVWKGIKGDLVDHFKSLNPGDHFHDKGYVSTTLDPNHATAFTGRKSDMDIGHMVHIKVPEGSKAFSVARHRNLKTNSKQEREVILPRNSKFQYEGKTHEKFGDHADFVIHHVTHIPEESK